AGAAPMWTAWSASRTCRAPRSQSEYTATAGIPSSRHARMTRTAISPRFAISTFTTSFCHGVHGTHGVRAAAPCHPWLQGNVAVFFRRVLIALGLEAGTGGNQLRPGLARTDHFVDEAARGGGVGVGELLAELRDPFGARRLGIRGLFQLAPVQNVDRALGAHHGDLGARPREVHVGPDMLA